MVVSLCSGTVMADAVHLPVTCRCDCFWQGGTWKGSAAQHKRFPTAALDIDGGLPQGGLPVHYTA